MEITVAGTGGSVVLRINGYENGAASNVDDANWLDSSLEIELYGFSARFALALTTHSLVSFKDEIARALSSNGGRAALRHEEQMLELDITVATNGRVTIEGAAQRRTNPRAKLSFCIDSDRTYVQSTLSEVEGTLATYPVVRDLTDK